MKCFRKTKFYSKEKQNLAFLMCKIKVRVFNTKNGLKTKVYNNLYVF